MNKPTSVGASVGVAKLTTPSSFPEHGYNRLEQIVAKNIERAQGPFFTTNIQSDQLWNTYLDGIPSEFRQHYRCNCCKRFIERYGGLVTIGNTGVQTPVLWNMMEEVSDFPLFFNSSYIALWSMVSQARVNGVFLWDLKEVMWGQPVTGEWTHLHGHPGKCTTDLGLKTPYQAMAEKQEDHGILCRSLAEYPLSTVREAVRILKGDAVQRSEKALGIGKWFLELHEKLENKKVRKQLKENLVWLATAAAPPGFCHVKNTMIGTLLDDIEAGHPIDTIQRKWRDKIDPLQYQRPQAEPKEGNIREAEKLVAQLCIERSLERRFARLEDVLKFEWCPRVGEETQESKGGVFDHLRKPKKEVSKVVLPPVNITWERFARTVLPDTTSIEIRVPTTLAPFYGLLTATHADSPPILQWDGVDLPRNPVSWYFYHGGSLAGSWNLTAGSYAKVSAVFIAPPHWQQPEKFVHQEQIAFFALEGCVCQAKDVSLCLFPEILKSELRPVRSVIEAHSRRGGVTGREEGNANGLAFQAKEGSKLTVRVTTAEGQADYTLDRWD